MVWWVIVVEMVVFAALFTTIIFTYYQGDRKYSPTSIHNYPPDIQDEYFKTHERKYLFKGTDSAGNACHLFVENNGYLAEVMRNDPFFHAYPRFMTDSPILGEYLSQQHFRSEVQGRDWGVEIRFYDVLKEKSGSTE